MTSTSKSIDRGSPFSLLLLLLLFPFSFLVRLSNSSFSIYSSYYLRLPDHHGRANRSAQKTRLLNVWRERGRRRMRSVGERGGLATEDEEALERLHWLTYAGNLVCVCAIIGTPHVRNKWRNMPWKVLVQDHPVIQDQRYPGCLSQDFITSTATYIGNRFM